MMRHFHFGVLTLGIMAGLCWLCLGPWGLLVKDVSRHPLLFSQRTKRHLAMGNWRVFAL